MRIGEAFPSKYLKASDIPDGTFVPVRIDRVEIANVAPDDKPEEMKPILYFVGKQKGIVLNKTNSETLAASYGDETDNWSGHPVSIYATETLFDGKMVPCLRLKVVKAMARPAPAPSRPVSRPEPAPEFDAPGEGIPPDDIPFSPNLI